MNICKCGDGQPSRIELRQARLIEAARKLFIEHGFHATSIAQIAHKSGIAVGQIYRDFSSKEDIVAALVRQDCRRFIDTEDLRVAIESGDADRIVTWLCDFIEPDDDPEGHRLFVEIVAESTRNDRIAAIFASVSDELRNNILTALASLAPEESVAEQRTAVADVILTISLGMLHYRLMQPTLDVTLLAKTLESLIRQAIGRLTTAS